MHLTLPVIRRPPHHIHLTRSLGEQFFSWPAVLLLGGTSFGCPSFARTTPSTIIVVRRESRGGSGGNSDHSREGDVAGFDVAMTGSDFSNVIKDPNDLGYDTNNWHLDYDLGFDV